MLRRICRVKPNPAKISLQLLTSKAYGCGTQNNSPKRCPCPNPQTYEHVTFDGERDFSAVIKALEMRLLCITRVGPLEPCGYPKMSRQDGQSQGGVAGALLPVWNRHGGAGSLLKLRKAWEHSVLLLEAHTPVSACFWPHAMHFGLLTTRTIR